MQHNTTQYFLITQWHNLLHYSAMGHTVRGRKDFIAFFGDARSHGSSRNGIEPFFLYIANGYKHRLNYINRLQKHICHRIPTASLLTAPKFNILTNFDATTSVGKFGIMLSRTVENGITRKPGHWLSCVYYNVITCSLFVNKPLPDPTMNY